MPPSSLTPTQKAEALVLLKLRHEQERVIWEKKSVCFALLDEIDELENKKIEIRDIAKKFSVTPSTIHYLLHRNKRGG